jgi:hypothetical protein
MMAELKRSDKELTTADLAGRSEKMRESEDRPQLVRNPPQSERAPVSRPNQNPPIASDTGTPAQTRPPLASETNQPTALFAESEVGDFRARWSNIQAAFVDEPRHAVEDADNLVASLMKKLAEGFANERSRLESQWDRGDNVSTEDLRLALQRYRSFFDRLLKV